MRLQSASSAQAQAAYQLLSRLQEQLVTALETVSVSIQHPEKLKTVDWLRDQGKHGGGRRFISIESPCFNRAAINFSQVHYPDLKEKALASATALSTIIHPQNPFAPSLHMHISWTELKNGHGYWRFMTDLNPALPNLSQTQTFEDAMQTVFSEYTLKARQEGDRYFYIPALKRHRGACHYYLEAFASANQDNDLKRAQSLGQRVIEVYPELIQKAIKEHRQPDNQATQAQLDYHSLYFLQVLTLDRGTTSGLLVHNQNDIGILGSIPARVNRELLMEWQALIPPPQNLLLEQLIAALPNQNPSPVSDDCRAKLAEIVRQHYHKYPEALAMQARASVVPPTVANHS